MTASKFAAFGSFKLVFGSYQNATYSTQTIRSQTATLTAEHLQSHDILDENTNTANLWKYRAQTSITDQPGQNASNWYANVKLAIPCVENQE